MTEAQAFELKAYDLGIASLEPLSHDSAEILSHALAAMPPWSIIGWPADRLFQSLTRKVASIRRFQLLADAELAGIIVIHEPWLHGPYLQLLAVLPSHQKRSLGLQVLRWMEGEARRTQARQLWLCVSTFNTQARVFYERFGFEAVSVIDRLASDASDELLMRKRLYYGSVAAS